MMKLISVFMKNFIKTIWHWFEMEGRTHLPWRMTRDPYAICVSEFMLQQTQVERVIPKYHAWLEAFPTWKSLAKASPAQVLRLWSGLGYNSRALRLQQLAMAVDTIHGGKLPQNEDELLALPGIGPYTAAAIQAFAFEQEVVVIDTNIERILLRYFWGLPFLAREKIAEKISLLLLSPEAKEKKVFSRYFFQALMDFGAKICKGKPQCDICPLQSTCKAYQTQSFTVKRPKQSHFPHSRRYYRGLVLKLLKTKEQLTWNELKAIDIQGHQWTDIIKTLVKDQLVVVSEKEQPYITLPN